MSVFRTVEHTSDICIIGAGMAGICAAVAAARNGATVTLINDRPVLGGNASEEIRMWICGAFGANMRETGIIEEIELENIYRNPQKNYSQWSALLFDVVTREANIELVLNASVLDADAPASGASGTTIRSVTAWQTTTQRYHTVAATLFMDCSGDSILAPLTGAEHRWGREDKTEFGETHAVDTADSKTMGMSCLIQVRETEKPQRFIPPHFAHRYEREHIGPGRSLDLHKTNFWWIESGGEGDTIHDTEIVRDDLVAVATGVWDFIKRYEDDYDARNWTLDWLGFLPGKRESRRYVGDHIISQGDVEAGGPFEDVIAYAGWSMDNHAPAGFYDAGEPTVFHPAPSPWGIPYRALYSKNVSNLMFAGRNISASHVALSSSRVMRTCSVIGQAAGTAAAIAIRHETTPRGVYEQHLHELQQTLLRDDAYLPGCVREPSSVTAAADLHASNEGEHYTVAIAQTVYPEDGVVFDSGLRSGQGNSVEWRQRSITADPEVLRNGVDRTVDDVDNGFWCRPGDSIEYRLAHPARISSIRIVFDSNLSRYYRDHRMKHHYPLHDPDVPVAESLVRSFLLEFYVDGRWTRFCEVEENRQRLVRIPVHGGSALKQPAAQGSAAATTTTGTTAAPGPVEAVRLTPQKTWGAELAHIFAFDIG